MIDPVFNLEQLALMHRCLKRSEELVARAFRIPALPSKHYPYEVVSGRDLYPPERAADAFAHLVVYERERRSGVEHLYRVCLQDDVFLKRAQEEAEGWLQALLVYVLTHELVHVVRFQRAEESFTARRGARKKEEDRVHQLTLELLAAAGAQHVDRLDALYGNPVIPARRVKG